MLRPEVVQETRALLAKGMAQRAVWRDLSAAISRGSIGKTLPTASTPAGASSPGKPCYRSTAAARLAVLSSVPLSGNALPAPWTTAAALRSNCSSPCRGSWANRWG